MRSFVINKNQDGIRLENFIRLKIEANQAFLFMMLRKKVIRINNVHPKDFKCILKVNDEVKIYLDDKYFKKEYSLPFDIIYEGNNLLIIDKPKGILVHSDSNSHNNVIDIVTKYLIEKNEYIPSLNNEFRPSLNNRLDSNTSGLLIISKNKETLELVNRLIASRDIKKYYLAKVKGKMEKDHFIYKDYYVFDPIKRMGKVYKDKVLDSKEIITGYKVLSEKDDISTLEVELITGRTHQIRSHLAFYNHPIIGDNKYGDLNINKKYKKDSQELVAYKLVFSTDNLEHLDYLSNKVFTSKIKLS